MTINLLLHILAGQGATSQRGGCAFSLSQVRRDNDIPKASFYRSVNELIANDCIERLWRDRYVLHPQLKQLCQLVGEK